MEIAKSTSVNVSSIAARRRDRISFSDTEGVTPSMFVLDPGRSQGRARHFQREISLSEDLDLPGLSTRATIGRNANFHDLTDDDRERLGGIEYRSLKLLLKIVLGNQIS